MDYSAVCVRVCVQACVCYNNTKIGLESWI